MSAVATGPRPNLFIVGGPKCGTTSLYRALRQHPEVFMSSGRSPTWPNKVVRSTRLREWLKFSPITQSVARAVLPRSVRQTIAVRLFELNRRLEPRRSLPPALRRQLQNEYASDIAALSTLIGRDLTHWTQDTALRTQDA